MMPTDIKNTTGLAANQNVIGPLRPTLPHPQRMSDDEKPAKTKSALSVLETVTMTESADIVRGATTEAILTTPILILNIVARGYTEAESVGVRVYQGAQRVRTASKVAVPCPTNTKTKTNG
jgi:hypothetical protein